MIYDLSKCDKDVTKTFGDGFQLLNSTSSTYVKVNY